MSREVRRVPIGWQHPLNARRQYQPMHDTPYSEVLAEYRECPEDYDNVPPDPIYYRPDWPADAVMGWCLYEDTSEGTPLSPVFATESELVDWLTQPQPIGIGGSVISMTRERAERFVADGWAPSMVYTAATGLVGGLEFPR